MLPTRVVPMWACRPVHVTITNLAWNGFSVRTSVHPYVCIYIATETRRYTVFVFHSVRGWLCPILGLLWYVLHLGYRSEGRRETVLGSCNAIVHSINEYSRCAIDFGIFPFVRFRIASISPNCGQSHSGLFRRKVVLILAQLSSS